MHEAGPKKKAILRTLAHWTVALHQLPPKIERHIQETLENISLA